MNREERQNPSYRSDERIQKKNDILSCELKKHREKKILSIGAFKKVVLNGC